MADEQQRVNISVAASAAVIAHSTTMEGRLAEIISGGKVRTKLVADSSATF